MDLIPFTLSWTPVLLLAVLAVAFKRSALELSLYGLGFTAALAYLAFQTPLSVIFLAGLDGVVTTLPLLLVVLAGILLCNLLVAAGAIDRLVAWFLQGLRHPRHRHLFITLGIGNFMEGASVIAEPIVAPMLRGRRGEPRRGRGPVHHRLCRPDEPGDGRHHHHGPGPGHGSPPDGPGRRHRLAVGAGGAGHGRLYPLVPAPSRRRLAPAARGPGGRPAGEPGGPGRGPDRGRGLIRHGGRPGADGRLAAPGPPAP